MTLLHTDALGKVIIAGEYSVLFGNRAIVAAIDRKAHCSFSPGVSFEFIAVCGKKSSEGVDHPLFLSTIKAFSDEGYSPPLGTYTVNTAAFYNQENGQKLGLGSSAAAIVSLCKAIFAQHNVFDHHKILNVAKRAHKEFSSGFGSGADIAASLFGDIITYQQTFEHNRIRSCKLAWAWSNFVFIDTKKSQSTKDFLQQVIGLEKKNPKFIESFCRTSEILCSVILDSKCNVSSLILSVHELFLLLSMLKDRAGIDITSKEHTAIQECAVSHRGSAKPSGAGGGDIALAVIPESSQDSFIKEVLKLGFSPLQLHVVTKHIV